jgi:hypothetical protein
MLIDRCRTTPSTGAPARHLRGARIETAHARQKKPGWRPVSAAKGESVAHDSVTLHGTGALLMDTVTILRDLWRHRFVVVAVYLVALLAGLAVIYKISFLPPSLKSRNYEVGVATARILVDTPSSQVVEVAPKGSDTLGVRANLLASLMVDGVVKSAIARRAGLEPNKLIGVTDAATEPGPVSAPPGPRAFVLTTKVLTNNSGDQLPIIELDAQAPDRAGAARLAGATIAGLRDYLDSRAALQAVPDADRLQVTGLGAPQATTQVRGPAKVLAVAAVILVFALGCAAILGVLALVRGWRAAAARERLDGDLLLDDDFDAGEDALFDQDEEPTPAQPESQRVQRSGDNWLAATTRPALVVPAQSDRSALDDDEPRAQSA